MRDPLSQTGFKPGEPARVHDCEAVYHEESYQMLLKENAGRCGCCGRNGSWRAFSVAAPRSHEIRRSAPEIRRDEPRPAPGGDLPLVTVSDAHAFFGRAVRFRGRVAKVHVSTKSGATFLQFAHGERFQVLKAVIFARYLERFERAGLDPCALEGRTITVRGLLRDHARWGPQLVVHDPGCITMEAQA